MRYRRTAVAGASYFTVVTYRRQPFFAEERAGEMLEEAQFSVQRRWPFILEAEVVLPDHLHAIWTLPEGDLDYSTRWRLIKENFTRAFAECHSLPARNASRRARGEQTVWQRRYWEHLIKDDRDFTAHLEYVHFNPVRHGLVSAPRDWPNSTFLDWVARGSYDPTWGSQTAPELPDWAGRE